MTIAGTGTRGSVALPADYVRAHVELAYAGPCTAPKG